MATSDSDINKKNAMILQQNIFYKDLMKITKTGFNLFVLDRHNRQFLHDLIEFTHVYTSMLEQYSKGKVLKIQTNRVKKVKKKKGQEFVGEYSDAEERDADFDP